MTAIKYDLHCHSLYSDGSLTPANLILRAKEKGVTTLALTDHDTVSGISQAQQAAEEHQLNFIPGIELSCLWHKKTFHILGLNIDPNNAQLLAGTQKLQTIRFERAQKIALKLEKHKVFGAFEAVQAAADTGMITRPHFAKYLIQQNHVNSMKEAFDRYLAQGKPAFVSTEWVDITDAIQWIKESGGIPVIAHPMRYKLTASWMRRFLNDFKKMGGQGIEIITARSSPEEIRRTLQFAKTFEFYGSVGSDFHTPDNQWVELGRLPPLPADIQPIWRLFN